MPKAETTQRVIAENRRARYDYFIEERIEAGLALEGWEVKSMRAGTVPLITLAAISINSITAMPAPE